MKKQVCVIPFTRAFLLEYTELPPTPLEIAESIDMMRVLEYGMRVRMIPTKHQTFAVDTKEDLVKVEKLMKGWVASFAGMSHSVSRSRVLNSIENDLLLQFWMGKKVTIFCDR